MHKDSTGSRAIHSPTRIVSICYDISIKPSRRYRIIYLVTSSEHDNILHTPLHFSGALRKYHILSMVSNKYHNVTDILLRVYYDCTMLLLHCCDVYIISEKCYASPVMTSTYVHKWTWWTEKTLCVASDAIISMIWFVHSITTMPLEFNNITMMACKA